MKAATYLVRFWFLDAWEDVWCISHEEEYSSYSEALAAARNWDGEVCPTDNPIAEIDWDIVPA